MSKRILTVEDDPAIRRGIVDALQFAAYDVSEAGTAEEGLRLAISNGDGTQSACRTLDLLLPLDAILKNGWYTKYGRDVSCGSR